MKDTASEGPHYENSPFTQVTIEFAFESEVGLDVVLQQAQRLSAGYDSESPITDTKIVVDENGHAQIEAAVVGRRLTSSEASSFIGLRTIGIVFGFTEKGCGSWPAASAHLRAQWESLADLTSDDLISEVTLGFQCSVNVPVTDSPVFPLQYVNIYPRIPAVGISSLGRMSAHAEVFLSDGCRLSVASTVVSAQGDCLPLGLQLKLTNEIGGQSVESLWDTLIAMNEKLTEAFEACITDHARNVLKSRERDQADKPSHSFQPHSF